MASRRHGGGGYGHGSHAKAKQLPFELFPEKEALGTASYKPEAKPFAIWGNKFEQFYKFSPYYVDDGDDTKKKLRTELKSFSNRGSVKNVHKGRLSDFIYMDPIYVPAELAKGDKGRHGVKRVKWNPDSSLLDDLFTKSLQREQAADVKKDVEDKEEEEEDPINEEEEEEEDDYDEPVVFDDDEDDLNPVEGDDVDEDPLL